MPRQNIAIGEKAHGYTIKALLLWYRSRIPILWRSDVNYLLKQKKAIAFAIIILFLASLALSAAYITIESNHSCIGFHCSVCAHMEAAQMVFQQLAAALLLLVFFSFIITISQAMLFEIKEHLCRSTLISQNIRMNN